MEYLKVESRWFQDNVSNEDLIAIRAQVIRQVTHWTEAVSRLEVLENFASSNAWGGLERYLGVEIRSNLNKAVDVLRQEALKLRIHAKAARTMDDFELIRKEVINFRMRYLRTETILDFYGHAINTRTTPKVASLLRACDVLARHSMEQILEPLGHKTPPVLTYLEKGLGASILKAGLRLWDGSTLSSVAAIKIVWHNLLRPTALIHETGHQVAHILGWTEQLAEALAKRLSRESTDIADKWASWASEIAADAFAFAHTGFAAVVGLHDVLSGDKSYVFQDRPGDPHPISYIRVLLGTAMCTKFFGSGPWDDLARAWVKAHPLESASPSVRLFLQKSLPLLPIVAEVSLLTPMQALGGRSLVSFIDPRRVSPEALMQLELEAGRALYTSSHWIWTEGLRILAHSGWKAATMPDRVTEYLQQQEEWMTRLGMAVGET